MPCRVFAYWTASAIVLVYGSDGLIDNKNGPWASMIQEDATSLAQKGFEDYMREGALAAFDAVEKVTGERELNAIGYCLGGTLLGATLGYLSNKNQDRVASATFFVSLLDFSEPGELGVFIDEEQVANLEKKMN